jgi:hypothetical protein
VPLGPSYFGTQQPHFYNIAKRVVSLINSQLAATRTPIACGARASKDKEHIYALQTQTPVCIPAE